MNSSKIDILVKFFLKQRKLITIFSLLGFLIGSYFTIKLYSNINSDLESLLADDSPTIKNLNESRKRFKLSDYSLIFVLAKDSEDGKKFTEALNQELVKGNHPLVLRTASAIGEELSYFDKNQLLFAPVGEFHDLDLKLHPKPKSDQVKTKKEQIEENFETIRRNFRKQLAFGRANMLNGLLRIPEHKLASNDGLTRGIIVFHSEPIYKIEDAKSVDSFLKNAINKLDPKKFGKGIEVKVSGAASGIAAESDALFTDIISSVTITLVLVTILLLFFYKNVRLLIVMVYVLAVGTTLSFIVTYIFIQELNSFTAFLCSIIIGNNINSGVIFLSLYIQTLKKNKNTYEAIVSTFHKAIAPTLLGCITTASAFGCLIFSNFRGYSEFGWIGMWGMVVGGCSTFIFLPPLLSFDFFKLNNDYIDNYRVPFLGFWSHIANFIVKFHRKIFALFMFLALIAIPYLWKVRDRFIETDMTVMHTKTYNQTNFSTIVKHLNEMQLKSNFFPILQILTNSREDTLRLQTAFTIDTHLFRIAPDVNAFSIFSLIPNDQAAKLTYINKFKNIKNLRERKEDYLVDRREEQIIENIVNSKDLKEVSEKDLPQGIRQLFMESDGSVDKILHVSMDLNKLEKDLNALISVVDYIKSMAQVACKDGKYLIVGSLIPLLEMGKAIIKDALPMTIYAFVSVLILFIFFYRNLKFYSIATLSFVVSVILFLAIIPLLNFKISVLAFVAIPLTFGIGVDYSSQFIVGYYQGKIGDLRESLLESGPFVIVESLTTLISYISILFSTGHLGLYNFATITIIGEFISILSALVIVPSILGYFLVNKDH